jgi:cyclin B
MNSTKNRIKRNSSKDINLNNYIQTESQNQKIIIKTTLPNKINNLYKKPLANIKKFSSDSLKNISFHIPTYQKLKKDYSTKNISMQQENNLIYNKLGINTLKKIQRLYERNSNNSCANITNNSKKNPREIKLNTSTSNINNSLSYNYSSGNIINNNKNYISLYKGKKGSKDKIIPNYNNNKYKFNPILNNNEIITEKNEIYNEFDISENYKINNKNIEKNKKLQNAHEYIDDIYKNLLIEESEYPFQSDPEYFMLQSEMNEKMRAILIDWLIEVHNKFKFTEETLFITISIIDNYLSMKKIQRINLQLLGITSLLIACKQNEIILRRLKEFVYVTDNAYTKDDLLHMENLILQILHFNILTPSPLRFYEILSYKLHFDDDKEKFFFGQFLMETFMLDKNCLKYSSSTIASAICYIVFKFFKMENYQKCYSSDLYYIKEYKEFVEKFSNSSHYNVYVIKECAKDICAFVNEVWKLHLKSTIKKYSVCNFYNVSELMFNQKEI